MNCTRDLLKTAVISLLILLPGMTAAEELDGPAPSSVSGTAFIDTVAAQQLHADGIPFVDVRPSSMYQMGRTPGAVGMSLPEGKFNRLALSKVAGPADPVVLHCRGKDCMMSSIAAEQAIDWGYSQVYYYRAGYNGWKEAGQMVEVPTNAVMQVQK
ncbi:rhodanese-like domain-containing protein [Solemya velum gill symbiont]|uniref:rhodanese-like domain-containing protein n=1 Tax=Solemya velum gill symbiont TaxID=2340 RepID=UPI000997B0B4|nr:rhodanese-like domain-containing protein [Solemya velum gill symbiont]